MLLPLMWSCEREKMVEESLTTHPQLQGLTLNDAICSDIKVLPLATENGGTIVDFCVNGSNQVPCPPGQADWGAVTYTKITSGFPDASLSLQVQLAPGWLASGYHVTATSTGAIVQNGQLPVVDNTWQPGPQGPFQNNFDVNVPLGPGYFGSSCFDWALRVEILRVNFFGQPITGSERTVWTYDVNGAGSPFVIDDCYSGCPEPVTTTAQGSCQGCRAEVAVTFTGCSKVDVTSCKAVEQVVIVYADCSREYHDNLTANSYSYNAAAGKAISHVYVRSGCRANTAPAAQDGEDTNGFSYPNVRRFGFDAACRNLGCN